MLPSFTSTTLKGDKDNISFRQAKILGTFSLSLFCSIQVRSQSDLTMNSITTHNGFDETLGH